MTQVSFGFPPVGFLGPSHLTMGTFDGLHRGHQALLKPLVAGAREAGAASVVVTFEPHPRCVLDPENCPANLTTLEEKTWLLDQLGLDHLVVIPFTPQIAALSPAVFMERLLRGIQARRMVIGENHRFGHRQRGDPAFLRRLGTRHHFTVEVAPTLARGKAPISSSRIRRLVLLGQVRAAAQLLGRDYVIRSTVEHGLKRGRDLGFPTANLRIGANKLLPATGIYAVRVDIEERTYAGALSVGFRPTFGSNSLTVEVYILDFDGDVYDRLLTVWFVQRLRAEKRFASVPALQQQMTRDVGATRRVLGIDLAGDRP